MLGMVLGLILKPRLLLLDEPFAGLNRVIANQVIDLLSLLRSQGIGTIIVEHDMGLLLPLCDRVTVFASGEILAAGTSAEILTRPEVQAAYFGADVARNP
jgi:ABC-type branched-subunit amino acid transport system ATPase component